MNDINLPQTETNPLAKPSETDKSAAALEKFLDFDKFGVTQWTTLVETIFITIPISHLELIFFRSKATICSAAFVWITTRALVPAPTLWFKHPRDWTNFVPIEILPLMSTQRRLTQSELPSIIAKHGGRCPSRPRHHCTYPRIDLTLSIHPCK